MIYVSVSFFLFKESEVPPQTPQAAIRWGCLPTLRYKTGAKIDLRRRRPNRDKTALYKYPAADPAGRAGAAAECVTVFLQISVYLSRRLRFGGADGCFIAGFGLIKKLSVPKACFNIFNQQKNRRRAAALGVWGESTEKNTLYVNRSMRSEDELKKFCV